MGRILGNSFSKAFLQSCVVLAICIFCLADNVSGQNVTVTLGTPSPGSVIGGSEQPLQWVNIPATVSTDKALQIGIHQVDPPYNLGDVKSCGAAISIVWRYSER